MSWMKSGKMQPNTLFWYRNRELNGMINSSRRKFSSLVTGPSFLILGLINLEENSPQDGWGLLDPRYDHFYDGCYTFLPHVYICFACFEGSF
jgi:hypothetical protein